MRRSPTRRLLLCGVLCAGTGLSGCAEIKGTANTHSRTQRPTAFYGTATRPTQPTETRRERALDSFLRGRRPARPGPRPGQPAGEVQPQVGGIVKPGGSLDEVFDRPEAPASGKGTYHRMQRGESLWAVARRYGVPVEQLVRANQIQDPSHIPVGTRIFIPDRATLARSPRAPERPSFEPEPLESATDDDAPSGTVPTPTSAVSPTPGKGVYHVVKDGDSLVGLARYYGVPQDEIRRWNEKEVAQGLPAGSTVFIPGAIEKAPRVTPAGAPARRVPGLETGARPQKVASFRPASAPAGFAWPVPPNVISRFGMRGGRPHTGLDIAAEMGTPIRAAMAGKVIYSGWMNGYGNVVILDHQNGYFTVYAHNRENLVRTSPGAPQLVRAGQTIALVGQTGNASRPHVHFEVRRSNDALDPLTLLPRHQAPAFAARDGGVGRG